ncbi:MAG: MurR/RpiR family transcriptional regulator [Boseongicola sp.]|nr:MurR/RpiR family transcriptional regulator [Boseongicola sp.]
MLRKLGFSGDGQFQAKLRDELCEMISGPVAKRNVWKERLSEGHFLNHHSRQALEDQLRTMDQVDQDDFDALCRLLVGRDRGTFVAEGRNAGTLAWYLYLHFQMMRPYVRLMPSADSWLHELLDLSAGDVLEVLDGRRHENAALPMWQMCHERGAEVVPVTDQWRSPVHRVARLTFSGRIAVPSAWDTVASLLLLTECVIASVQETLWASVRTRTDDLEAAFEMTGRLRKFE